MKRVFYLALAMALIACGALPSFLQEEPLTPGTSCDSPTPTGADITAALNFGRDVFTEAEWIQEYELYDWNVFVEYIHRSISAVAVVEILMVCNNQSPDDFMRSYLETNMDVLVENYQPWNINNQCAKENLILYEIRGKWEAYDYDIRLWGKPLNSTRVLNVRLVVRDIESEKFKEYSNALFPELPACP